MQLSAHVALLEVRTTSCALRETADRVLYEHIVVAGLLPDTTKSLLSPLGDRLPVQPELLQPCPADEAEDKVEKGSRLLAKARLIDFVVPPGPRAKMAESGSRSTLLSVPWIALAPAPVRARSEPSLQAYATVQSRSCNGPLPRIQR